MTSVLQSEVKGDPLGRGEGGGKVGRVEFPQSLGVKERRIRDFDQRRVGLQGRVSKSFKNVRESETRTGISPLATRPRPPPAVEREIGQAGSARKSQAKLTRCFDQLNVVGRIGASLRV